jgi:hypothetical protein
LAPGELEWVTLAAFVAEVGTHCGSFCTGADALQLAHAIALDVNVILTPPQVYISLVILHTKYTRMRQQPQHDSNVYA